LVKLELWVPPAARADIQAAARSIIVASSRGPTLAKNPEPPRGQFQMDHVIDTDWSVKGLSAALAETNLLREGEMTVRVLEGTEPVLHISCTNSATCRSSCRSARSRSWSRRCSGRWTSRPDQAAFNVFLLKAQKLVPLSNFGITTVSDRDYYEIFGEISCKTTLQTVIIELRMLAENAIKAASDLRENFASAA
jgi:uncharacterized protein YjfI (DUF2170 family)